MHCEWAHLRQDVISELPGTATLSIDLDYMEVYPEDSSHLQPCRRSPNVARGYTGSVWIGRRYPLWSGQGARVRISIWDRYIYEKLKSIDFAFNCVTPISMCQAYFVVLI
jgi:hypothetical protein